MCLFREEGAGLYRLDGEGSRADHGEVVLSEVMALASGWDAAADHGDPLERVGTSSGGPWCS